MLISIRAFYLVCLQLNQECHKICPYDRLNQYHFRQDLCFFLQEQLRLRTKYRTLVQASLVKTEGAVFQKRTNFNVCAPWDLKGQRAR